jgi:hypothetical protein
VRLNNAQMCKAIHDLTPAQSSTGSLRMIEGTVSYTARLPERMSREYFTSVHDGDVTHTVLSYATPIAWRLAEGCWVIPEVKYSVTTSKHQGIVRVATSAPESYFDQKRMQYVTP